jgi:hypothetical protein
VALDVGVIGHVVILPRLHGEAPAVKRTSCCLTRWPRQRQGPIASAPFSSLAHSPTFCWAEAATPVTNASSPCITDYCGIFVIGDVVVSK